MFPNVFFVCALAVAASAYHIPYESLETYPDQPRYGEYGMKYPFMELMKTVLKTPYEGYYKYPYYNFPEQKQIVDIPEGQYNGPYRYPYLGMWDIPYGYKYGMTYPFGTYEKDYPYTPYNSMYGYRGLYSYPVLNKMLGNDYYKYMMPEYTMYKHMMPGYMSKYMMPKYMMDYMMY